MKLFRTNNAQLVETCQINFGFLPVGLWIDYIKAKFLEKYLQHSNFLCSGIFSHAAKSQLDILLRNYNAKDSSHLKFCVRSKFLGFETQT
jgi:hypothetical protein